jgi:thiol-disulfide isomerase/thioredoxin
MDVVAPDHPSQLTQLTRPSRRVWLIAIVLVALLVAATLALVNGRSRAGENLRPLGVFDLPDLRQPTNAALRYSNASLLGKPAVITVFDSTCTSCREELPMMNEVAQGLKGRVALIGVDHLDRPGVALGFVDGLQLTFPIAYESTGDLSASWKLAGLPTTLFVDSSGHEVGRVLGAITRNDLMNRIQSLS